MRKSQLFKLIISLLLVVTIAIPTKLLSSNVAAATPINLYINAGKEVYPFTKLILGTNVGAWQSQGWYKKDVPNYIDQRMINLVEKAGIGMLRFPAGEEAERSYFDRDNRYDRDGGITPPAPYTRTLRADMLDAFIQLCKKTGAEPLLVVNAQFDNANMAADMVRYCNIEKGYNVKYWEVGNEIQYWHDKSSIPGYPSQFGRYSDAMKKVDPKIKVFPAAPAQPSEFDKYELNVIKSYGSKADGLTVHWYPLYDGVTDKNHAMYPDIKNLLKWDHGPNSNVWTQNASIAYANRFIKTNAKSLVNYRDKYVPGGMIAMTEISPVAGGDKNPGVSDVFGNALFFGDMLGRLAYNGTDIVTQFLLQSVPQNYAMTDNSYNPRPIWYTYVMYSRFFGDMMVETMSDNEENLTIWTSTKTGEKDKLYVMVVNKNANDNKEATLHFNNFVPTSGQYWELTSTGISARRAYINGVTTDGKLELNDIPGKELTKLSENYTYTFPAHSITSFVLTGKFEASPNAVTPSPIPTEKPEATPTPKPVAAKELLSNPGFESNMTGWKASGSSKISSVTSPVYKGKKAARVTNRKKNTDAITRDLTSILKKNGTGKYTVSAFTRLAKGTDKSRIVIKVVTDKETKTFTINGNINSTKWLKTSKNVNLTWKGTIKSATMSIYTAKSTSDLFVDNVSIKK